MRYLKKKLMVLNDGFAKSNIPARDRMDVVINRYVAKMSAKGWIPRLYVSEGNAYNRWEAYVRMVKPTTDQERIDAIENAICHDWVLDVDGNTWKLMQKGDNYER